MLIDISSVNKRTSHSNFSSKNFERGPNSNRLSQLIQVQIQSNLTIKVSNWLKRKKN